MSHDHPPDAAFSRIQRQFNAEWQRFLDQGGEGTQPDFELHLQSLPDPHKTTLRSSLTEIDLDFRRKLQILQSSKTSAGKSDGTVSWERPGNASRPPSGSEDTAELSSPGSSGKQITTNQDTAAFSPAGQSAAGQDTASFSHGNSQRSGDTIDFPHSPDDARRPGPRSSEATADFSLDAQLRPIGRSASTGPLDAPSVPGYEIVGVLGRGGMGIVYRANHVKLKRAVALKMILGGDHAAEDQLARFRAEAEAVAQLQHPNIVQVYDVGEHGRLPFFSLEFIDGRSLDAVIGGKPIQPRHAAELLQAISRAMHYAHQRGIVHRDLKPANILLTSTGVPKVTDFGLVKRMEGDSAQTRTGMIMGTPSYMAPEQGKGDKDVGPLADVYALGAVLYATLTGRPPFLAANPLDTLMQMLNDEAIPPSRLQPSTPADLETICLKCLQKDKTKRYADAAELADDLQRFLDGVPIAARPVGRAERVWRWCRRNPRLAITSAVAGLLAIAMMIGGPVAAGIIYQQKELAVAAKEAETKAKETAEKNEKEAIESEKKAILAKERETKAKEEETRAKDAALEAKDKETKAKEEAIQAKDSAQQAIQQLIGAVQDLLIDQPGALEAKQKILQIAMTQLNRVSGGNTLAERKLWASAHRKMGDALLGVGLAGPAHEQYERCHQFTLAMQESAPDDPVQLLNLGRALDGLGKATLRLGGPRQASDYYAKSLELRKRALTLANDKQTATCRRELSDSYEAFGRIALEQGQPRVALESARLAIENLEAGYPEQDIIRRRRTASNQRTIAEAQLQLGDIDQALGFHQKFLEQTTLIAQDRSQKNTVSARANMALAHNELGVTLLTAKRIEESREHLLEAERLFQQSVAENNDDVRVSQPLASVRYALGVVALRMEQVDRAREYFAECLAPRQQLVEKSPGDLAAQVNLMVALARNGKLADAARIAEEMVAKFPEDPSKLYQAGCCLSICAEHAQEEAQGSQFRQRALQFLAQGIQQGYHAPGVLRLDPDLAGIQSLPELKPLIAQIEAP